MEPVQLRLTPDGSDRPADRSAARAADPGVSSRIPCRRLPSCRLLAASSSVPDLSVGARSRRGPLAVGVRPRPRPADRDSMSSRPASSSENCLSRSTNAVGSSRSAADGSRSGCAQSASRPSVPRDAPTASPQVGGGAQPARPQLQPDQGREGLLGRAAGGPAATQGLAQRGRAGQPVADRVGDHGVHPALDQREQRLELGHRAPAGPG